VERFPAFVLLCAGACSTADGNKVDAGSGSSDSNLSLVDASDDDTDAMMVDALIIPVNCGDGSMDMGEACDDNNNANNDGCNAACALEPTQAVTLTAQNLSIVDDGYNGTIASMACVNVTVGAWYTPTIANTTVTVGADHEWIGDLVIKAVAPDNTTVTLVSRPGIAETVDDGTNSGNGTSAELNRLYPITFVMGAPANAENMGQGITQVCGSNNVCMFAPNNGAAAAGTLASFNGKSSMGTWKLCVGDGGGLSVGKVDRVTFTFTH
jgi:cysteine-rich repeat protein